MADRNGYIGRAPGDSSVVVARQTFSPTGIQTDFTFASGYVVGYLDLYLNGARLIEGQDFTATDGSVVGLTTYAQNGDVLELVAYKAFNVANISATGSLSVGGDLTVSGVTSSVGGFNIGISSGGTEITPGPINTLNFIGLGNTFAVNGTTVDISISGNSGAGGTWSSYTAGIATSKSVGINTDNLDNSNLTGVGNSFQGIYISNGMIVVDNELNGNHYIGTNFNGLMAGPVTVNGTLSVDGNYIVV
jgi:hypothetical protein